MVSNTIIWVPFLYFEVGPGVLLSNFDWGPGVPFLNFRRVPAPEVSNSEGGPGSRSPGSQGPGPTFTPCHIL